MCFRFLETKSVFQCSFSAFLDFVTTLNISNSSLKSALTTVHYIVCYFRVTLIRACCSNVYASNGTEPERLHFPPVFATGG